MARESINVVQQIGVESTPGTPVAATKRFAGLSFDIGDTIETQQFVRAGAKADTSNQIIKEWAQGNFNGPMSYVEIVYILAGLYPYTVTPGPSNAYYTWDFLPNANGNDAVKTFTLEKGDDEAGERHAGLQIQSCEMNLTENEASLSGSCFAYGSEANALTSSGLSELAERTVSPRHIDVYMDDTFAGIGTTKITDAFEAKYTIGEKFQPKWVLNTSYASYKESKEVLPGYGLQLATEYNSQGRALALALKQNPYKFFRVRARGSLITGSVYYQIATDFCGKVQQKTPEPDLDGIYGYRFDFRGMQEATMGRATSIQVINLLPSL